jgi:hypothetical protein
MPIVEVELGGASAGRVECVSFGKAVPLWLSSLAVAGHLPHGRHQAGTATSTSMTFGTTFVDQFTIDPRIAQIQTIASGKPNVA